MSTYRELVYMVLDELKLMSDDASYTEDHVVFLLNKYRALLLKQRYSDVRRPIPESNCQTICLDLIEVPAIPDGPCESSSYLRSKVKVPNMIKILNPGIYPVDYFEDTITFISRNRMKYVGYNKYMKNIIYATIGPDNYIYLTSNNPHFVYLDKVRITAVFEDPTIASTLACEEDSVKHCNIMDAEFPMEEGLMAQLVQIVVKELAGPSWRPEDSENNASDDLANLANFIARNTKSDLQKKMQQ